MIMSITRYTYILVLLPAAAFECWPSPTPACGQLLWWALSGSVIGFTVSLSPIFLAIPYAPFSLPFSDSVSVYFASVWRHGGLVQYFLPGYWLL